MRFARRWMVRRAVRWAAVVALVFGSAGPAAAQQESDLTRARSTFQQAVELEQAGNCSAALPLFRQVGQVRMTPQVRFHIAFCEAQLGRLVAALGGYELALADADTVGPAFREEVEENIKLLRQRVPRLIIQRGGGAEAAMIELDGVALGSSSIGVEVPLDPGPHVVRAEARGYKGFEATVTLAEGDNKTLEVALEPQPQPEPGLTTAPPPGADAGAQRRPNLAPYIIGGVGVASLVTSGVLFALRQGTLGELEDACDGNICSESERDEYDRLQAYHYGSIVTLGVGVAAVGTAATLIVLDRRAKHEQQARLTVLPRLLPHEAGATVRVRF